MTASTCAICGNQAGNRHHLAREMMFGRRDTFSYLECARCGTLQNVTSDLDVARYYPSDYYAFSSPERRPRSAPERWLKRQRSRYCLSGQGLVGRLLTMRYGEADALRWVRQAGAGLESAILDVGAGAGELLAELAEHGFADLAGIDPYVSGTQHGEGYTILQQDIAQHEGQYDLVMLHHSFEHMPEPGETLQHVRRLLAPQGVALIRTPVADSWAWEQYGTDWVQLDPPRHLFVHTRRGLELLAQRASLRVVQVEWDSSELQYWGSEQYRQDIPLASDRSYWTNPAASIFSEQDILRFRQLAADLNAAGRGDQAAFYLSPA